MEVGKLVQAFQFIIRDRGKEMTTDDINKILHIANYEKLKDEFARYEESFEVTESLSVLHNVISTTIPSSGLLVVYDYERIATILKGNVEVDIVTESELSDMLTSTIIAPTTTYPICIREFDKFRFYPANVGTVTVRYFKKPETPLYVEKIENGIPVHDALSSINLSWGDSDFNDILNRMLSYVGISIPAVELTQFGEAKK
jgi:hypothetical protein